MQKTIKTYRVRAEYHMPEYTISLIRNTDTMQQYILIYGDGYVANTEEWDKNYNMIDLNGKIHIPSLANIEAINKTIKALDKEGDLWAKQQEL